MGSNPTFSADQGQVPYRPDRVTGAFRTLRDRLDLQHITFHSLRHFPATGRLGHVNPGITLRTYAHFLDAADREAADALGAALAGLFDQPTYCFLQGPSGYDQQSAALVK